MNIKKKLILHFYCSSKDPQWALVCVVFLVTLVLVGVWYCGMCKNKHTEYIDPVVTHNLKPEFVKGILSHVFSY